MSARTAFAMIAALLTAGCASDPEYDVSVVIPADVPTIESGVLRLSYFSSDPRLADAAATLVDEDELMFSHVLGTADEMVMRVSGEPPHSRVYLVVRGYGLTDAGEVYVLWDGQERIGIPDRVVMQVTGP